MARIFAVLLCLSFAEGAPAAPQQPERSARAKPAPSRRSSAPQLAALQQQVMLDRAGFSPGVIDGHGGSNTARALAEFQKQGDGAQQTVQALTSYRITEEDAAGPYFQIPEDMAEQSALPTLGYTSLLEALAERFHATPALLQQLNPGVTFAADQEIAGQEIQVPNVDPMAIPIRPLKRPATNHAEPGSAAETPIKPVPKPDVVVTVSKSASSLTVTDSEGHEIFYAPVTTGSVHDPLPVGEWKVNGVQMNPTFHYNPDLFWDADPAHSKTVLPAGPNSPVGLVWIDISKPHYGLHGTPEPAMIGRTESHGCVRLTNWDALKVATLVKPGTRIVFME